MTNPFLFQRWYLYRKTDSSPLEDVVSAFISSAPHF
jgi:hypothetical protein